MSSMKQSPSAGQVSAPTPMRWSDPEMVCELFYSLRTLIKDAQGAAEDQLLPRRERRLGHLEAERITREAFTQLDQVLSFAERDLPLRQAG